MNVKTLSSPYGNCSNCNLKVRVSLNLQLESVKHSKFCFQPYFSSIQIQISHFACNPPMSGNEFHLIKELTYSRLMAICTFEPPFFAYLLCGSLLKELPKFLSSSGRRGANFIPVQKFSAQQHASFGNQRILNFRVMAVHDISL